MAITMKTIHVHLEVRIVYTSFFQGLLLKSLEWKTLYKDLVSRYKMLVVTAVLYPVYRKLHPYIL